MKLTKQVWLVSSVALAACGGGSSTADAPIAAIDAPPGGSIDAPIGSPDGAHTIDAATSPDAAVPGPVTAALMARLGGALAEHATRVPRG